MVKRHPGLRELSSDHQQGLVHGRRLVLAVDGEEPVSPEGLRAVASAFLAFWEEHTVPHFREEEELMVPAYARYGDPSNEAVVRMSVEHAHIRRLVDDLRRQMAGEDGLGQPNPATMLHVGEMLRDHIRFEENVLFPLIEQALPEEELLRLGEQLTG